MNYLVLGAFEAASEPQLPCWMKKKATGPAKSY